MGVYRSASQPQTTGKQVPFVVEQQRGASMQLKVVTPTLRAPIPASLLAGTNFKAKRLSHTYMWSLAKVAAAAHRECV